MESFIFAFLLFVVSHFTAQPEASALHSSDISGRDVFYAKELSFHTVKKGETLESVFARHGLDQVMRHQIMFSPSFPKKFYLIPGDTYAVQRGAKDDLLITFFGDFSDLVFEVGQINDQPMFWNRTGQFETKVKKATGTLEGSLFTSFMREIPSEKLAYRFKEAFGNDFNFAHLAKGSPFEVTYEEKYFRGRLVRYGEILKASVIREGKEIARHFVGTNRGGSFISLESDESLKPLYSPVSYPKLTSLFQRRRFHPIRRRYIAHMGIDFELPEGWPVMSVEKGQVLKAGKNRASGNYITILHNNGLQSTYAHLHSIHPQIKPGYRVKAGEPIGTVGSTGFSTKPHLHFGVKRNGIWADPLDYIKSYAQPLEQMVLSERERLRKETAFN